MTAQTQPEALQMAIRSMIQEAARQRARIAELEVELMREAQRTAAEKLRADQMTEQHRMQSAMNAEARGELAQLREKRQPTQLYRLLRSGELMREGDECLDDGTMTWHPVRNGWHSFPWSVINNPVRRVIEAAHNITGEPA